MKSMFLIVLLLTACKTQQTVPQPELNKCIAEYDLVKPTLAWPITKEEQVEGKTRFTLRNPNDKEVLSGGEITLMPNSKDIEAVRYYGDYFDVVYARLSKDCFKLVVYIKGRVE